MSTHELNPLLVSALRMLAMIPEEEISKGIETMERFLAVGYITDPTFWRDNHLKVQKDVDLMRAVQKVRALMKEGTLV